MQRQADAGPGREAAPGEGASGGGLIESAKEAASVRRWGAHRPEQRAASAAPSRLAFQGWLGWLSCTASQLMRASIHRSPQSAMDAVKQANPATRDLKEPHC